MQVACILVRQEQHGVCFDVKAAEKLAVQLADELQALKDQLQQYFPPWQRLVKRAISKVNNQKLGRVKGQEYEVWETIEFNPNSNPHIVKCLKDKYGWEPTVFTDKGNPQLDDEILADLDNLGSMPEVSLIRKYKTASKILGYVSAGANSWLNHVKNGRIHGNVQGCGAGTRRMTHNSPNLGQVPSVRAYLGKECRALFSPPLGYLMVGIDADQLELRTLSHFLFPYDGGEYAHAAIHGSKENKDDIHWRNAKAIGVDRDSGKTVFYA
jgi:DNA polymerase I